MITEQFTDDGRPAIQTEPVLKATAGHESAPPPPAFYHLVLKCCKSRWGYSMFPVRSGQCPVIKCRRCGNPMPVTKFERVRWMTPEEIFEFYK